MRPSIRFLTTAMLLGGLLLAPSAATATPKPGLPRTLSCGDFVLETVLAPGGFGSAFLDLNSNSIYRWLSVETTFEGELIYRFDNRSVDVSALDLVHCNYVDPIGLEVSLTGFLTPARPS